jgi:hypothetical protein
MTRSFLTCKEQTDVTYTVLEFDAADLRTSLDPRNLAVIRATPDFHNAQPSVVDWLALVDQQSDILPVQQDKSLPPLSLALEWNETSHHVLSTDQMVTNTIEGHGPAQAAHPQRHDEAARRAQLDHPRGRMSHAPAVTMIRSYGARSPTPASASARTTLTW